MYCQYSDTWTDRGQEAEWYKLYTAAIAVLKMILYVHGANKVWGRSQVFLYTALEHTLGTRHISAQRHFDPCRKVVCSQAGCLDTVYTSMKQTCREAQGRAMANITVYADGWHGMYWADGIMGCTGMQMYAYIRSYVRRPVLPDITGLFSLSWAGEGYARLCSNSTTALVTSWEWKELKEARQRERDLHGQQKSRAARLNGQKVEGKVWMRRAESWHNRCVYRLRISGHYISLCHFFMNPHHHLLCIFIFIFTVTSTAGLYSIIEKLKNKK